MALTTNRMAWKARKDAARRVLDDHALVRERIRKLILRVDERLRSEAIELAAERAEEIGKIERERIESLTDASNDEPSLADRLALVRR